MEQRKLHSGDVEVAVARLLNYRIVTIVPNVFWGLGLNHECDMLALDDKKRFTEIEIKISGADLKADFKKEHGHKSKLISRLVYAMPDYIFEKYGNIIPKEFGVITVKDRTAKWVRRCRHQRAEPVPQKTIDKFLELGCMRIWSLKEHNYRNTVQLNRLRKT